MIGADNGREFIADTLQEWLAEQQVYAAFIEKASPQQNCYIEPPASAAAAQRAPCAHRCSGPRACPRRCRTEHSTAKPGLGDAEVLGDLRDRLLPQPSELNRSPTQLRAPGCRHTDSPRTTIVVTRNGVRGSGGHSSPHRPRSRRPHRDLARRGTPPHPHRAPRRPVLPAALGPRRRTRYRRVTAKSSEHRTAPGDRASGPLPPLDAGRVLEPPHHAPQPPVARPASQRFRYTVILANSCASVGRFSNLGE